MGGKKIRFVIAFGLCTLLAVPALADTKAGVDAWTRGDYTGAVTIWEAEAAKGDIDAMFDLGQAYKLGKGVKQDMARAETLFAQAAAVGHLQAADNYGLLLWQRGERAKALPYVRAAADRGDPRAQYLLGVMHFNGDLVPKDWVRAYALVTLANQQGLAPAANALGQMNEFVPLEQRQKGVQLAAELGAQADATRARQFAAIDLGSQVGANDPAAPAVSAPPMRGPTVAAAVPTPAPTARMGTPPPKVSPPVPKAAAAMPAPAAKPAPRDTAAQGGTWRIQLGAFGQPGNASALWSKVKSRPELAGHPRVDARSGAVTRLLAGGYSQAGAQSACKSLKAAGFACVAVAN